MRRTEESAAAFLKCKTKAYLKHSGTPGAQSEFSLWRQHQREEYRESCRELLCSALHTSSFAGTPNLQSLKDRRHHLVLDDVVAEGEIHARLDALMLSLVRRARLDCPYIPIRFVPSEKLSMNDKLLLAFDAVAFSQPYGKSPLAGRILHWRNHIMATVPLPALFGKIQAVLRAINDQQTNATPPPLALNKHCAECEFRSRCRQPAIEKDDLSLLPNISEKERKKQNDKGIFTVLQLSYTFQPRRRPAHGLLKHQPALKALALRKNQIHIFGSPALSLSGTPVHIDVEGDPDRDFYYLVGLRIGSGGSAIRHCFWASDLADERTMWECCLRVLSVIDNPQLIHYGSYETQFLKRMRTRYPNIEG